MLCGVSAFLAYSMHLRTKSVQLMGGVAGKPTAADLALLADSEYVGPEVDAESVRVRSMELCHDQHDRSGERFPKEYLDRFAETIQGRSVLPGHDTGSLPLARFYAARVEKVNEPDFPMLVTRREKTAAPPGFEAKAQTVRWVKSQFYYPASDQAVDDKFRTRVWRWASIGFRFDDLDCDICKKSYFSDCPHLLNRWTDSGRLATATYSGDAEKAEALEGSVVYLGAQQEAGIEKRLGEMCRKGCVDPVEVSRVPIWGEVDLVTLKLAEQLAREHGHKQHSWAFPALASAKAAETEPPEATEETDSMDFLKRLAKALGLAETATEDEVAAAAEKAKADAAEAVTHKTAAEKAAADLAPAAEKLAAREPLATVGEKALKDLRDTILADHLKLDGNESTELAEITEHHVSTGNYDRLKALAAEKREAVWAKFPTGISGDPAAGREADEAQAEKPQGRAADYQLF